MESISSLGAIIGLAVAILLIIVKIHPVFAIIAGALCGGLCGGYSIDATIQVMFAGAQSMVASGLRILTSGVFVGALVKTKSAEKISVTIIRFFGEKRALIAIALASMLICSIGVFIPIAVITVAPIAIDIKNRTNLSTKAILIALIGGGKAGNIISLNPNTIAVAESFGLDIIDPIIANLIPALVALVVTVLIASILSKFEGKGKQACENIVKSDISDVEEYPNLFQAIVGPVAVIVLLLLKFIVNVNLDPLIVLPAAGLITILATGNIKLIGSSFKYGISKVSDTFLLLLATGTIAGVISTSSLTSDITSLLNLINLPIFITGPLSGMLLAAATASTTAGATISSQSFAGILIDAGVPAVSAAAVINASATIIDSMPHGSFFHASADAVGMNIKDRIKLMPLEALVGLSSTITGVIIYAITTTPV